MYGTRKEILDRLDQIAAELRKYGYAEPLAIEMRKDLEEERDALRDKLLALKEDR